MASAYFLTISMATICLYSMYSSVYHYSSVYLTIHVDAQSLKTFYQLFAEIFLILWILFQSMWDYNVIRYLIYIYVNLLTSGRFFRLSGTLNEPPWTATLFLPLQGERRTHVSWSNLKPPHNRLKDEQLPENQKVHNFKSYFVAYIKSTRQKRKA